MKIKEYMIRMNELKRPYITVSREHETDMVHELSTEYSSSDKLVNGLKEIFDIESLTEEYVWMVCMTAAFQIIGVFEIAHGSINSSVFNTRGILQRALLANATYIVVAHCHPSGYTDPSDKDIVVTKQLYDACALMEIGLLDHIIIGCCEETKYYSFKANQIFETWEKGGTK